MSMKAWSLQERKEVEGIKKELKKQKPDIYRISESVSYLWESTHNAYDVAAAVGIDVNLIPEMATLADLTHKIGKELGVQY